MVVLEDATGGPYYRIVIAGLDGIGRARTVFTGTVTEFEFPAPHPAYVVKGTVYFIDGFGTVFSMGVDGKQTVVTRFPIQDPGQRAVSFAVSPDGCQFAATLLAQGFPGPDRPWVLQTMKAAAGGSAELLHTWTSPNPPSSTSPDGFKNLVLVGWDSLGPVAVAGSSTLQYANSFDTLNYVANPDFLVGEVVHLAGDGTAGAAAAPSTCKAAQVSPGGDITCFEASSKDAWNLSVLRSTGGAVVGGVRIPVGIAHSPMGGIPCKVSFHPGATFGPCTGAHIATGPNGLVAATWAGSEVVDPNVSAAAPGSTSGLWRGPDGGSGTLPAFFHPEGWIDAHTIFGQHTYGFFDAALVRVGGAQSTLEDLQFVGNFVGALSA
jgi:hypothetical protein